MSENSPRLGLPLLAAGQAQKELYHNEALLRLEMLTQPVVTASGLDLPPSAPAAGQCWIVGSAPGGDWIGHAGAIACWSEGGWRFVAPFEGMCLWDASAGTWVRRDGGHWVSGAWPVSALTIDGEQVVGPRQAPISAPAGGANVDLEARAAVAQILAVLRSHGLTG